MASSHSTPTSTVYCVDYPMRDTFEDPFHEFTSRPPAGIMSNTDSLLVCAACGTQFDVENRQLLKHCRICDDPRQFVPPTGQAFTTLGELKNGNYRNKWKQFEFDDRFYSIWTEPKVGIGQRCILIKTPLGNVLWDCITYLDPETITKINEMGGLAAIVISHPHYYTTHLEWADTFDCPVYLSWEDKEWLNRLDRLGKARTFIEGKEEEIEVRGEKTGVKALKLGGHFPGSLVCLAFGRLLIADTLVTTPSGLGDWTKGPDGEKGEKPPGMTSFAFMWSIPNMIPLSAEEIQCMWEVLKGHEFVSTHGAFVGTEIRDGHGGSDASVKRRVLDSMQIQVGRIAKNHAFMKETI
jgi:glyoxylase-like metal-dependent hydrolase (beta-lactamase superfamily II)